MTGVGLALEWIWKPLSVRFGGGEGRAAADEGGVDVRVGELEDGFLVPLVQGVRGACPGLGLGGVAGPAGPVQQRPSLPRRVRGGVGVGELRGVLVEDGPQDVRAGPQGGVGEAGGEAGQVSEGRAGVCVLFRRAEGRDEHLECPLLVNGVIGGLGGEPGSLRGEVRLSCGQGDDAASGLQEAACVPGAVWCAERGVEGLPGFGEPSDLQQDVADVVRGGHGGFRVAGLAAEVLGGEVVF